MNRTLYKAFCLVYHIGTLVYNISDTSILLIKSSFKIRKGISFLNLLNTNCYTQRVTKINSYTITHKKIDKFSRKHCTQMNITKDGV